ncbi:MAG: O-antigen ligase family protein [Patescibacteria group bacterium]|jgi:O-antigen ligase
MDWQKNIKNILLWGTLAALWTPLIFYRQAIFPYISPKNFFFRFIVAVLSALLIGYILQRKKLVFSSHKIYFSFLVFLLVNLIAAIFAVNPQLAFFGSFERMGGWFNLFFLSLFFLIVINVFETKDDWLKLLRSSVICSAILSIYSLIVRFGHNIPVGWPKNGATLGNIDFLGAYLMLSVFLGLLAFVLEKNNKWRMAYGAIIAINLIVLLLTAARAGILGLFFGLFIFAIFIFIKAGKKIKYSLAGLLVILILFGGIAYQQKDSAWVRSLPFLYRFTQISLNDASTKDRLLVWYVSWQAFGDRPIIGYGSENAIYGLNKYYNPRVTEMWFDRAHNFIFDILLASGLIGLLFYLSIFGLAFWLILKNLNRNYYLGAILFSSLAGYLASNLFNFDTISSWLPVILILAFIGHWTKKENSENNLPRLLVKFDFITAGTLIFILALVSYFTVLKPAYAGYFGSYGSAYADQYPDKAIVFMERAISLNTYGNRELAMQLSEFDRQYNESSELDSVKKKEYFDISEKALLDYLKSDPNNIQPKIFLALLYQSFAKENSFYISESIRLMEGNINNSPQRIEIYNILAQGYYLRGDYDRAVKNLKVSLSINNWDEDQYLNLINILSQRNDLAEMNKYINEFLTNIKSISPDGYKRLGQYYFNVGNVDEAERVVRDLAIPANPDYLPTRIALASIYESRGEYDRAINYTQEMINIHPEWAETLNNYIKYLNDKKNR